MRILVLAALAMLAPCSAFAADAPATAAPTASTSSTATPDTNLRWAACATDLQKFCAGLERGKGKKRACLESHAAELSGGCKARMGEHAAKQN